MEQTDDGIRMHIGNFHVLVAIEAGTQWLR